YLYEPGLHIPMIVWAPGLIRPGTVIDDLVCTTDISATVLKLAGAEIPDYITAKPFLGVDHPQYRSYVRSARDIWDEIDECSRSITTKKYSYIKNYMPEIPWATDQAYLELNRPALWSMRKLKAEGNLSETEMTFFRDRKPAEELYDLKKDPNQLHNLAGNPEYAEVLSQMRSMETDWQSRHKDYGLEDLGKRTPEQGLGAVKAREWVQKNHPDWWQRLENGELMATHRWIREAR
ncbi:MAG: sulfatase/phosphatase domain-containing protein, partial [Kiritimatiellales bacterium]